MGQAGILVEIDDGGLGVGAKLGSGRPQRVGGLQRMSSLHAAPTAAAAADVDVELPLDRSAWDLDLVLLLNFRFRDRTAAVGTSRGQEGFVGFVDLVGRRRRPMSFLAVVIARLAAGLLRLLLEHALGEGSRLAFAGTAFRFEKLQQPLLLRFEFLDAPPQRQTSMTQPFLHTDKLANGELRSCASLPEFWLQHGEALNNYNWPSRETACLPAARC